MPHYVYIIHCINNTYYTGYTTDIRRRYKEHEQGSEKCRYTRSFPPKKLVAYWSFDNKSDALKKEAEIKKLSRDEKIKLIKNKGVIISSGVQHFIFFPQNHFGNVFFL